MEHIHLAAIQSASRTAAQAHAGMTRKDGTTPYIVHPARVAALVGHCGGNHIAIISAWLHDIFEDCTPEACSLAQETLQTLPLPEGEREKIQAVLRALTKNPDLPKEAQIADSLDRILTSPPEAVLVKLCDRIDNLVDAADRDESFRTTYYRKSRLVLEKLRPAALSNGYDKALGILEMLMDNAPGSPQS